MVGDELRKILDVEGDGLRPMKLSRWGRKVEEEKVRSLRAEGRNS